MDDRPDARELGLPDDADLSDLEDVRLLLYRAMANADEDLLALLLANDPTLLARFEADDVLFTLPGYTILHEAIVSSTPPIVRFLIEQGADVNAHREEVIGDTPLDVAVKAKNWEAARMLLEHGANPNIPTWMWITATNRAIKRVGEHDCTDPAETRALSAIVSAGERHPPPTYPDGTVPETWPPTPDNPYPSRVKPDEK